MTLEEAIEEVKRWKERGRYWPGAPEIQTVTDVIIYAVASRQLVRKADADLAVAEALRKAGDHVRTAEVPNEETSEGAMQRALLHYAADVLSALANQDHLAEVQALRAERDAAQNTSWYQRAQNQAEMLRAWEREARDNHARAAAALAEVARLTEAVIAYLADDKLDTGILEAALTPKGDTP